MIDPTLTDIISQADYANLIFHYKVTIWLLSATIITTLWAIFSVGYIVHVGGKIREKRYSKCFKCGAKKKEI